MIDVSRFQNATRRTDEAVSKIVDAIELGHEIEFDAGISCSVAVALAKEAASEANTTFIDSIYNLQVSGSSLASKARNAQRRISDWHSAIQRMFLSYNSASSTETKREIVEELSGPNGQVAFLKGAVKALVEIYKEAFPAPPPVELPAPGEPAWLKGFEKRLGESLRQFFDEVIAKLG